MGGGVARLELCGSAERGHGLVPALQRPKHQRQVRVIGRIAGLVPDGLLNQLQSLGVLAGLVHGHAQQVQRVGVIGHGLEDLAVQRLGLGQPARLLMLDRQRERLRHGQRLTRGSLGRCHGQESP